MHLGKPSDIVAPLCKLLASLWKEYGVYFEAVPKPNPRPQLTALLVEGTIVAVVFLFWLGAKSCTDGEINLKLS